MVTNTAPASASPTSDRPEPSKVALITGCSSGIGRATALALAAAGYTVYASARRPETLYELTARGCHTLALDVTDEVSIEAAVAEIEAAHGTIGILINNAGYSQSGAVEDLSLGQLRRQFETNVFGLVALTQRVLPGMRAQGWGKVVNISSMGGRFTFPGGGAYHASKHALEALSDALRFEVKGFGVDVIVIQPGLIRSGFAAAVAAHVDPHARTEGPYAGFNDAVVAATERAYVDGPLAKLGGTPEDVATVILRALAAKRPRARYTVTASAKVLLLQRAILPDWAWDAFLRANFPQPGAHRPSLETTPTATTTSPGVAGGAA